MKSDWLTKIILTGICLFLGILALGRSGTPNEAMAQAQVPPVNAFEGVEVIPHRDGGFILFDKKTGQFCAYEMEPVKGFPFSKASGGRIEKVGAEVQKLP